jgi:hypothetical protein
MKASVAPAPITPAAITMNSTPYLRQIYEKLTEASRQNFNRSSSPPDEPVEGR